MLKDEELIARVSDLPPRGRPFTGKQIDLCKTSQPKPICHREHEAAERTCGNRFSNKTATADVLKGHQPVNV